MKKFKFSLEKILQLKEQILKNLKNNLGTLQMQLREKEKDIESLKIKYRVSNEIYNDKSSKSIMPYEIKFYKDYMNSILNSIKKAEEEKELILKKIEAKKQEIIDLNIEISSIEKLKEKKLSKYNYQVQKVEEILIEEFVSSSSINTNSSLKLN